MNTFLSLVIFNLLVNFSQNQLSLQKIAYFLVKLMFYAKKTRVNYLSNTGVETPKSPMFTRVLSSRVNYWGNSDYY